MMTSFSQLKAWTLTVLFLLTLVLAPLVQVALEWQGGDRIQLVDVCRYAPTEGNLRRYERGLEDRSWCVKAAREIMREALFVLLGELGNQAITGRGDWVFYRPGVRYLVEGGQADTTRRHEALAAIARFRDQLRERGIELLVVPVPGKASVYPDRVTRRYDKGLGGFRSRTEEFLEALREGGTQVLDLFGGFREARGLGADLYLKQDTHWTPAGAELAAELAAERLLGLGWVGRGTNGYTLRDETVCRHGDILEMTQLGGVRDRFGGQVVKAHQVVDPDLGLLVPSRSERPGTYGDPRRQSKVLLLGDSFSRVYQFAEPQSLGERLLPEPGELPRQPDPLVAGRLFPGSAGFLAHLARALARPVDGIVSDGGASTEVRRQLSVNPEILEGKEVVVWEFVERDIELGEWEDVPLPRRLEGMP